MERDLDLTERRGERDLEQDTRRMERDLDLIECRGERDLEHDTRRMERDLDRTRRRGERDLGWWRGEGDLDREGEAWWRGRLVWVGVGEEGCLWLCGRERARDGDREGGGGEEDRCRAGCSRAGGMEGDLERFLGGGKGGGAKR